MASPGPAQREEQQTSKWSVPLGRIAGIELRVHLTFLALVALFAMDPDGPIAGIGWLVIIFACVVAHELAHSLVARRRGATVREIVLLPIGGVSRLENLPENPRDEFAIAIVGPLTSFALGVLAAVVCVALGRDLWPVDLATGSILHRLAWFNLIVGAFNLLPAYPLDGGRVLRSLLERRYDLETATRIAARVGRVLAAVMVGVGFLVNLFLLIIGIFVWFGASAEEAATVVHLRLEGHVVGDAMLTDPVTFEAATLVGDVIPVLRRYAQRSFPVTYGHDYVGLLHAFGLESVPGELTVGQVLDRDAPTLAADADLEQATFEVLVPSRRHALAVLDGPRVVGLLSRDDVNHLVTDEHRDEHFPRAPFSGHADQA
ncbi:MAG: site-2 protease family protein [Acidimicrobiia bacterium]